MQKEDNITPDVCALILLCCFLGSFSDVVFRCRFYVTVCVCIVKIHFHYFLPNVSKEVHSNYNVAGNSLYALLYFVYTKWINLGDFKIRCTEQNGYNIFL